MCDRHRKTEHEYVCVRREEGERKGEREKWGKTNEGQKTSPGLRMALPAPSDPLTRGASAAS